jgi:hypothetical protein
MTLAGASLMTSDTDPDLRRASRASHGARTHRAYSPFQSRAWLNASGASDLVDWLTASDGTAGVGAWLADPAVSPGRHYFHSPRSLLAGAREKSLLEKAEPGTSNALEHARAVDWGTAVVTVSPYGYRGGALAVAATPGSALSSLADQLLAYARQRGASHVLSHYLIEEHDGAWIRTLTEHGGIPLVLGADAVLDIRWASMEEYHAWLGSTRRSLRGRAERGESGIVWSVRSEAGLTPYHQVVPELLERHAARFDPVGHPPAALLEAVSVGRPIPRLLFTAAEPGAAPRSALAVFASDGVLYPKFFGTATPRTDYFPLVYSRLIAYAIANGHRRIEYGGGSHRAKLFRGARLRPLLGVLFMLDVRLRDRVLPLARQLSATKLAHFSALAERWHLDHAPLARPFGVDLRSSTTTTTT